MVEDFIDFWIENVYFSSFKFSELIGDSTAEVFGGFAGFISIILFLPVTIALFVISQLATVFLLICAVLLSPILLPFSIWNHFRNRVSK